MLAVMLLYPYHLYVLPSPAVSAMSTMLVLAAHCSGYTVYGSFADGDKSPRGVPSMHAWGSTKHACMGSTKPV